MGLLEKEGYRIVNIDTTISLQQPKLKQYIPEMQLKLAPILGIQSNSISIKATTTEKLGFIGREEGISAHAIVLIEKG